MNRAVAILVLAALLVPTAGFAQSEKVESVIAAGRIYELQAGAPAPVAGVLVPEPAQKVLNKQLRERDEYRDLNAALLKQLEAANKQIANLEAQVETLQAGAREYQTALAVWRELDKRREADEARLLRALDLAQTNNDRVLKTLDRANARIETLEKRQFWLFMLGPIGAAIGFALGLAH